MLNKGESLLRLTESCEISVRNMGREGDCVALEITQKKAAGGEVTTLLLCGDRARELASVLLHHSGGARADAGETVSVCEHEEEAVAVCAT